MCVCVCALCVYDWNKHICKQGEECEMRSKDKMVKESNIVIRSIGDDILM